MDTRLPLVLSLVASLAMGARLADARPLQSPPPAAPAQTTPPPATPPATPPTRDPDSVVPPPPAADEANANLPEGLKVRDPGPQPKITGGAAIYFHALDHDFGRMTNAETKHHRFTFVNAGDQPLTIEAVVPKCGCTKPTFERGKTYQPGESGFIDIDFTPPTGGHQAKAIVVKSNATWPADVFNIRVIGNVESVLSFTPKTIDFGELRRGEPWEKEVTIVADAKATIFEKVAPRVPGVTGTFLGEGPHKGEVKMKIVVDPKSPWGSIRGGLLMIDTRGKDDIGTELTKTLPFRVLGVIVDEIRADEYIFQMGTVRPGNPFTSSVFISHEGGKPIEVSDVVVAAMGPEMKGVAAVTYAPAQLKPETRDGKPGYLITVYGTTPGDAHGFFGGNVKFKTKTQGDAAAVDRELPLGGRVMTEEAERNLPGGVRQQQPGAGRQQPAGGTGRQQPPAGRTAPAGR